MTTCWSAKNAQKIAVYARKTNASDVPPASTRISMENVSRTAERVCLVMRRASSVIPVLEPVRIVIRGMFVPPVLIPII